MVKFLGHRNGRNNNSSRFGKYNRVFFDESGTLVDASVSWKPMECELKMLFLPPDDLNDLFRT